MRRFPVPRWYHLVIAAALAAVFLVGNMVRGGDTDGWENVAYWIGHGQGLVTSKIQLPLQECTPETSDGLRVFVYQPFGPALFYSLVGYGHALPAHKVLHVFFYALLALLTHAIARKFTASDRLSALCTLLVLANPVVVAGVSLAYVDLVFVVFFIGAVYLLAAANESPQPGNRRRLVLAAAVAGVLCLSFRALGLVLLVSFAWFRAGDVLARRYRTAIHDTLAFLPFVAYCIWFFARNYRCSGSLSGLCPPAGASACSAGLAQGVVLGCKQAAQVFLCDQWSNSPATLLRRALAPEWSPLAWLNAAFLVLVAYTFVRITAGMWRRRTEGPLRPTALQPFAVYAVTGACYLGLLVLALFGIGAKGFEVRYYVPLVVIGWPMMMALGQRVRRPALLLSLVGFIAVGYVLDDVAILKDRRRQAHEDARIPEWVAWLEGRTAEDAAFFTNCGEVSARHPQRRVYKISTWHCGYSLPQEFRSEDGLVAFLDAKAVRYLVFARAGNDSERALSRAQYGAFIADLMEMRAWTEKIVHADGNVVVYDRSSANPDP